MKIKINLKSFWIISVILIIIFSIFSIFQISSVVSEIRLVQDYEKELEEIKKENEILIVDLVKINSLNNGNEFVESFDFVRIEKVHHIQAKRGDVVVTR